MRPESWEAVARALGERMSNHANACMQGRFLSDESGRSYLVGTEGEFHDADRDAETCPFCADTLAYRRFVARTRGEHYTPATL